MILTHRLTVALAAWGVLLLAAPLAAQERRIVSTPNAPAAIGPYSQAVQTGNILWLAGQIAIDPATNQVRHGTIEEETRLVLDNLKAVVEAAGMTMANIVSVTVFLKDLDEFPRMNAVYATYFPNNPPARATVQVARLPRDVKIEIAAVAVR
ncbi:MAG: RidA family protein [Elioraea sp.]|nr:RidA family protein [Elioraea sp.]